jgi:Mg2+-importing ATPase
LIELAKRIFFADVEHDRPAGRWRGQRHRIERRAARFSHRGPLPAGNLR